MRVRTTVKSAPSRIIAASSSGLPGPFASYHAPSSIGSPDGVGVGVGVAVGDGVGVGLGDGGGVCNRRVGVGGSLPMVIACTIVPGEFVMKLTNSKKNKLHTSPRKTLRLFFSEGKLMIRYRNSFIYNCQALIIFWLILIYP